MNLIRFVACFETKNKLSFKLVRKPVLCYRIGLILIKLESTRRVGGALGEFEHDGVVTDGI